MNCGIYKITIGDKYYYGQSARLKSRLKDHARLLRQNKHSNTYMQNAYNKHQDFDAEIVLYCDEDNLDMYEQIFLDQYHGLKDCMNLALDAKAPARGRVVTLEERQAKSKRQKGKKRSEQACKNISEGRTGIKVPKITGALNHKSKEVVAELPDGSIKTWGSLHEACRELGVAPKTLCHWCNGTRPQPGSMRKMKATKHLWGWVFYYAGVGAR
jgi:group I intron endonuclease